MSAAPHLIFHLPSLHGSTSRYIHVVYVLVSFLFLSLFVSFTGQSLFTKLSFSSFILLALVIERYIHLLPFAKEYTLVHLEASFWSSFSTFILDNY